MPMQIDPTIDQPKAAVRHAGGSQGHVHPFRKPFLNIGNLLAAACTQAAGAALVFIVVICTINVFGRYLFSHALSWAEESMVFAMIFAIFLGSAAVTWRAQHMFLDMALNKLPLALQRIVVTLTLLGSGVTLIWVSTLSWQVVSRLMRFGQLSDALEIPMWIPQSFVMVGLFLNGFMMILRLFAFPPLPPVHDIEAEAKEAEL